MDMQAELEGLPHGPEFKFIHEILSLDPGKSAEAKYDISGKEVFLNGHFPGQPLWPGVIMIEAIAQLGGVVFQSSKEEGKLENLRLTAVKKAKILETVGPGEELRIQAQVEARLGHLVQISGSVSSGDRVLAQAVVMLSGD